MVAGLFVKRVGRGPRVVLVHGGVLAGELCWSQQLRLADRFALEVVDRAGYGRSQQVSPGEDLDADAPLAVGLQAQRAHLPGAGHATPETGDAFNETLEAFICASRGATRHVASDKDDVSNIV